jgi:hypothetical protein
VQLSSSSLPAATWQTPPAPATPHTAQANRAQNTAATNDQTPANPAPAESTPSKDGPQRPVRRGRPDAQDAQNTQQTASATANPPASTATPQALAFQAVLSDLLPPDTLPGTHNDPAASEKTPLDQNLAKALPDATPGSIRGNAAHLIDPTFQIAKEPGLGQKLAEAQVAFAARVVDNTGTAAALHARDAESQLATSRFTTERPAATPPGDPQTAQPVKKADPEAIEAAPPAKATAAQPAHQATDNQNSTGSDSNSNSDSDAQQRDTDSPLTERASSAPEPDNPAPQAAQNAAGNLSAPAPATANPSISAARTASPARGAAESGPPQILEPQGEAGTRAGESVREISLRLTNADQSAVQVRLTERAGELHVSVRTPDVGLTRGLRDGLPDLMGKLQVNGYRAETWQPGGNGNSTGQDRGQDSGHSQQRNGGGAGSHGQQQDSRGQEQEEQTPKWVNELETSIQRSSSPWQPVP